MWFFLLYSDSELYDEWVWSHVFKAVHFLLFLDSIFKDSWVDREDKTDESAKEDISVFDRQLICIWNIIFKNKNHCEKSMKKLFFIRVMHIDKLVNMFWSDHMMIQNSHAILTSLLICPGLITWLYRMRIQ